jgi:uroporphyrinogen decarboxylase
MNSLERIQAAVDFHEVDRLPVIGQVFGHAAHRLGIRLRDYLQDGSLLAECQLKALDYYDYDAVFALMDVNVEAEAVGAGLAWREHQYAAVCNHPVHNRTDLDRLPIPDPYSAGRMPELLEAAHIMRDHVRDEKLVTGCVCGPMTLTSQLTGLEALLYCAADTPGRFAQLLDYATEIIGLFGGAQIDAGVHLPLVFDPAASPGVIPATFFREFELPRLKEIFSSFKARGACANWLHITGPIQDILEYFPEAGVDIANFDYCVSADDVIEALPGICLEGNIKPLDFSFGDEDTIQHQCRSLINKFAGRGGFILSSGCEVPLDARPELVNVLIHAAHQTGSAA